MRKIVLVIFLLAVSFSLKAVDNLSSKRKAIFHKEKVLDENQSLDFEYSFIEGIKFKMLGDYKMAIKWFNRCLSIDKTSSAVRYELAGIYILNSDYNSAMYLLRDAIKYNPHNIWYKLQLADIYRKKSMIKQACDLYNKSYDIAKSKGDRKIMRLSLDGLMASLGTKGISKATTDKYLNKAYSLYLQDNPKSKRSDQI